MKNNPEQLYDLKELISLANGEDGFTEDMIKLFIAQIETSLPEISGMHQRRDFAKVKMILHKMKPSIMVMGITSATDIILQIEHLDLAAIDEPTFRALSEKLENTLREVVKQLRLI
jgi:HPt (histidine-containing phosphotransfer) domain-containing protein